MRAVVFDGELRFADNLPAPEPAGGECMVQVHQAGICSTDLEITRGYMGFAGVLGHEFVGRVEAGSEQWLGKRVVSEINCVCMRCDLCQAGLSTHCRDRTVIGIAGRSGAMADRITVPVANLHAVPDQVTDEQAVFVEPLAAAYQVISQCRVDAKTKAAVVGSGRLGLLVAQVLRESGCALMVVGRNPRTLEICEKLSIQPVHVDQLHANRDLDVVVECTGSPKGLALATQLVRPRGTIVLKSTYAPHADDFPDLAPIVIDEITLLGSRCGPFPEAIAALARGAINTEHLVTRSLPIERAVEAFDLAASPEHVKVLLKINP